MDVESKRKKRHPDDDLADMKPYKQPLLEQSPIMQERPVSRSPPSYYPQYHPYSMHPATVASHPYQTYHAYYPIHQVHHPTLPNVYPPPVVHHAVHHAPVQPSHSHPMRPSHLSHQKRSSGFNIMDLLQ
jgi:hypothetical protein